MNLLLSQESKGKKLEKQKTIPLKESIIIIKESMISYKEKSKDTLKGKLNQE